MQLATIIILTILSLFIYGINMAGGKQVTLKEKIGQMLIVGFEGAELDANDAIVRAISLQQIGGVILFDYNFQTKNYDHNIKNPLQLKKLVNQLQSYARAADNQHGSAFYPLFVSIDYEGGKVNRLQESYGFPKTLSAAEIATHSVAEAKVYIQKMAETLQQAGINLNFSPVLDVNVNPDNPVIGKLGRSFSHDPSVVYNYAALYTDIYKQHGIVCAYKHFPGHGSSLGDTHAGLVDVTKTWKKYELEPYKQFFKHSNTCSMVMNAHVVNKNLDDGGYPASLSKAMTTELLRKKLGFDGVVITDDLQMKAIKDHYGTDEAVRLAINAGADMLIFGNQLTAVPQDTATIVNMIYADVQAGKISAHRINEAYQRIMKIKMQLAEPLNSNALTNSEKASTSPSRFR
jgi:beta-N-acetylhexosaminidase